MTTDWCGYCQDFVPDARNHDCPNRPRPEPPLAGVLRLPVTCERSAEPDPLFSGENPFRASTAPKPGYVWDAERLTYVESITTYAKRLVNERAHEERGTMPCPGPGRCGLADFGVPHEDLA